MQGFEKKVCPKCGNDRFIILKRNSCDNCPYNGAYDEDLEDWIYDDEKIKLKGLVRDEAFENASCAYGNNYD